jgi:hypothetical protein
VQPPKQFGGVREAQDGIVVVVPVVGHPLVLVAVMVVTDCVVAVGHVAVVAVGHVADVAVVVVMPVTPSGAHNIFGALGAAVRVPNWSDIWTGESTAFGHFTR